MEATTEAPALYEELGRGVLTSCCHAGVDVTGVVRDMLRYPAHELREGTLVVGEGQFAQALGTDKHLVTCQGCGQEIPAEVEEH